MKKNRTSEAGLFTPRVFIAFLLCAFGALLAIASFARPSAPAPAEPAASAQAAEPGPGLITAPGVPRYREYQAPPGLGDVAGEPTLGWNPLTRRVMYIANLQTLQVTFPDELSAPGFPPGTIPDCCDGFWKDVSFIGTKLRTLDPILWTDRAIGRTFVSQLNTVTQASPAFVGLNSLMAYTDDDGASWTPAQLNPPDSSNDHQTVGSGPYPPALAALANSVNKGRAVYYCAQAGRVLVATSNAVCSRSDDGGLTFNPPAVVYPGSPVPGGCSQLIHGHLKVAPDGTVYLTNSTCGGDQALVVSTDGGLTWAVRRVPNSEPGTGVIDPSVGISKDPPDPIRNPGATSHRVYFGFTGKVPGGNATDNHAYVAWTDDRGLTWHGPVDVGAQLGIKNAVFAAAVAGDWNRAAVAYLGTTTGGNHQAGPTATAPNAPEFPGTWYGLIAHTYDGGATWTMVNATPNGPVQREACIWNGGGSNPCRNLLDFNDAVIDTEGKVLFSFADGCIADCETGGPNTYSAKATIARQMGGLGLYAEFDPPQAAAEPNAPDRPCLSGRRDDQAAYLKWNAPDNGGSGITLYRIFRSTGAAGTEVFIGQETSDTNYTDRDIDPTVAKYTYRVTAVNAEGEGLPSNSVELAITPRLEPTGACALPGVTAVVDPAGDQTSGQPQHDITSVSLAEPEDKPDRLVFTIKVANLQSIPPGWRWAARFIAPQGPPAAAIGPAEDWFVSMVTSDGAAPAFTYGSTAVPSTGGARIFTTLGTLDPASNATADGNITLILPKSVIDSSDPAKDPVPGARITGILGSVRAAPPSPIPAPGGTNETIPDSTGGGFYVLRPANLCKPNAAPVAVLSANPEQGVAPLEVTFDGSASNDSDTDPQDTIVSYTFNFGDGGDDVTTSSPTITHTFTQSGEYPVRLVVTDSRGKVSGNTALAFVEVEPGQGQTTPTPSASPTTSASPTASPSPTAGPGATPADLLNISTRGRVAPGDNSLIAGFIMPGQQAKRVLLRGIGPSLKSGGQPVEGRLEDPVLELYEGNGVLITSNDNWRDAEEAEIQSSGFAPEDDRESVIMRALVPGVYTAIMNGKDGSSGLGLVEVYDNDSASPTKLANISTRGFVDTNNNVLIGGFITGGSDGATNVVVRALGPSLSDDGVANPLQDPMIELVDANGSTLDESDDWKTSPDQVKIAARGLGPDDDRESAALHRIMPGNYTAIVRGKGGTTGIGLVEIYNVR